MTENTEAIEHLNEALAQLRSRRDRRKNAGTLGTHLTETSYLDIGCQSCKDAGESIIYPSLEAIELRQQSSK